MLQGGSVLLGRTWGGQRQGSFRSSGGALIDWEWPLEKGSQTVSATVCRLRCVIFALMRRGEGELVFLTAFLCNHSLLINKTTTQRKRKWQ